MPDRFKYRALAEDGRSQSGVLTAEGQDQVLQYLSEQQLLPISIKPVKRRARFALWGFFKRTQYEDLIMFTSNLSTMYRAGIPLLRALSIIRVGPSEGRFNYAIDQIRLSLQSGKTLSGAMTEFEDLFPRIYTASVAAGEESGKLDDILDQLTSVLSRELELTRQIKAGVRYPLLVVLALAAAFVVMITFVVPRFVEFYGSFNAELPIYTRVLIGISDVFAAYWPVTLALVVSIFLGFKILLSNEKARLVIDKQLLRLPVFGNLIIKGNVARFSMMFRIMLQSGLPMVKSLDILTDSVKNSMIAAEVAMMKNLLEEGKDSQLLSGAFVFFPDLALQMMSIGLESGSLERMLDEVGEHYSREVQYVSKQLTTILEPILTLGLGAFVLFLALSIFLPMWNLIKVFNGP